MITGDKSISPNNADDLKRVTNINNKDGSEVKIVLISQAGSEGLGFQIHSTSTYFRTVV